MTLEQIFSASYLFDPTPPPESRLNLLFLILFGLFILASVVIKIIPMPIRAVQKRYFACFFWSGVSGLVYIFGRYEGLPWLGARFVLLLIVLCLAVWVIVNTVWALRFIPQYTKREIKELKYKQYLPKPKTATK